MAVTQTAPADIDAYIQGEISGQVAVGNHILQIGSVHGGVVKIIQPEQQPRLRMRPTPVSLRPRPFPNLLNRETEVSTAKAALQSALPVEFYAGAGLGKTSLLRHLAHYPLDAAFPDGIVYLLVRRQSLEDLLQSLVEAFYESDVPAKLTDAQVRRALQNRCALILLDDVELKWDDVEALMDAAPRCVFLLASEERRLWGEGQAVALAGLPPDEALALVERELGRALTSEERPAAQALCAALGGHPLRILQAAAMARQGERPLAEVARQMQTPSPAAALRTQVLGSLSEPQQRVLAALAALGGAPVSVEHLAALTKLPNVVSLLETLQKAGVVQAHSPRYSLTGTLGQDLRQMWDLTPWAERSLVHFTRWAEQHRRNPERLLEDAEAIVQTLEWAAEARRWQEVLHLGGVLDSALTLGRRWGAWARVLQLRLQAARVLGSQAAEAWALHQLGTRALCLEDSVVARTSLTEALRLREALGDRVGAAVTRHNLNILLGPPPPPQPPSQAPSTPSPAPGGSLFPDMIIVFMAAVAIVLSGLVFWQYWPWRTPPPTAIVADDTATPTRTPRPPTATFTPTRTRRPPTATFTPTRTRKPPTPTFTFTPIPTPTPIIDFMADPDSIEEGQSSTLWWHIENVQAAYLSGGRFNNQGIQGPTGSEPTGALLGNTTYSLRVMLRNGSEVMRSVTVRVTPIPPPAPTPLGPGGPEPYAWPVASCPIVLSWTAVSDSSGIASYYVRLQNCNHLGQNCATWEDYTISGTSIDVSSDIPTPVVLPYFRWRVWAADNAGNQSERSPWRYFKTPGC